MPFLLNILLMITLLIKYFSIDRAKVNLSLKSFQDHRDCKYNRRIKFAAFKER